MRKTYFISDLHLSDDRSDITEAFFTFLDEHMNTDVDALYILGDFFEVWIGDDERAPLANLIAEKLTSLHSVTTSPDELIFVKRRAKDVRFFSKDTGVRRAKFKLCIKKARKFDSRHFNNKSA